MNILNFFVQNWDSIVLVVAFLATLYILWYKGQKKIVYKILYGLVTEAEKKFGNGTGSLKQSVVFTQIYDKLPSIFRAVVSASTLENWIEIVLANAKEKWEANSEIKDYINE